MAKPNAKQTADSTKRPDAPETAEEGAVKTAPKKSAAPDAQA